MSTTTRTLNMVIAALGGEGGGVLADWLVEVAEREGWLCQTTSLAGVAQRTGATIYYLEMFPRSAVPAGRMPVMSLFPTQGDIDIAVASEVAEAGRMVQRGFVSPGRTTLIASDHRVYGITEKQHLGNGVVDAERLRAIAGRYARRHVHFDMQALAERHGTVISAVLLGAIAGSGALPFGKSGFEAVIEASGKAVRANLAAFEAGFQRARPGAVESFEPRAVPAGQPALESDGFRLPQAATERGRQLLERARVSPASCHEVLYHALQKLLDYQDHAYAAQFLDEAEAVLALDDGHGEHALTREAARYLALWMCYEDMPRVAQLKTRAARMHKVREEVRAEPGQLFHVTEFFAPRVEEICAMLPAALGRRVQGSRACTRLIGLFTGGKRLRTNTVGVYLVLRALAACRRWRRASLGYAHEHGLIRRWLAAVRAAAAAPQGAALARELVECGRLVKGYGETRARTCGQVAAILARVEAGAAPAADIRTWREAALADDENKAFRQALGAT